MEKLIIDEKKYYLFGRNPDLFDFTIDHQSHSSVHAAHEESFLSRFQQHSWHFLGSHSSGTSQASRDSHWFSGLIWCIHKAYTLREKPQTWPSAVKGDEKMGGLDDELKGLQGLPEEETEIDNLTEFNTANGFQLSLLRREIRTFRDQRGGGRTHSQEETDGGLWLSGPGGDRKQAHTELCLQRRTLRGSQQLGIHGTALSGDLPMPYPNLVPDVDLTPVVPSAVPITSTPNLAVYNPAAVNEPKKKKPTASLLI
ncbi:hypothetical protein U0070_003435 [Myodes glareolus]|uniref:Uncharacterized protein n=1 Tax=Myodes glareolus TaxID=447135 RepID=A0AAW0JTC5_MYOGA